MNPHIDNDAAHRLIAHLWALIAAHRLDAVDPSEVLARLAAVLDENDIQYVRNLPLAGFGEAEESIDLFLPPGVAVLLDVGPSAPNHDRLRRCALPIAVLALAVLTDRSPDEYPAGHSQRHLVNGKSLSAHRIARTDGL